MIQTSKQADERLDAKAKARDESLAPVECWCLHGAVGAASDWRGMAKALSASGISTRAVDLWRFLECESVPMPEFGRRLNAEADGEIARAAHRILIGYSMGGRLALNALIEGGPWDAAVIISANPGLRDPSEAVARRSSDTLRATQALTLPWQDFLREWNAQPMLGGAMRDSREDAKLIQRRREIARSFVDWSLGNQQPLWDRLPAIKTPTLWVAGENDVKFRAIAEEASALSGNFQLAIAPDSGHRVPWENEAWLAAQIAGRKLPM
ncbi:alpha/beta fold hydrolase [Akkermansiaceae bacterium]|nr:alpha/beta fold hydrolase [Akkermansiaceae bacterium]